MKIYCIGIGPGGEEQMTLRAVRALEKCDCVAGYGLYLDLIENLIREGRIESGMTREVCAAKRRLRRQNRAKRSRSCPRETPVCTAWPACCLSFASTSRTSRSRLLAGHHGGLLGRRRARLAADV